MVVATVAGSAVGSAGPATTAIATVACVGWIALSWTRRPSARWQRCGALVALCAGAALRVGFLPAVPPPQPGNFAAPRPWSPVPRAPRIYHQIQDAGKGALGAIQHSVHQHLRGASETIAVTMILNRGDPLEPQALREFRQTGTLHLLAISGLHLTLVLELVGALAGTLGATPWSGRVIAIALVWCYTVAVGAPASAVRAAAGATLAWVAHARRVPMSSLEVLGRSTALVLWMAPRLASDLGFQLSVAATAALSLAPRVWTRPPADTAHPPAWVRVAHRYILTPLCTTLVVSLVVYPILAQAVGTVPALGSWANLLAVPIAEACLLGTLVGTACDHVSAGLADAAWHATGAALAALQAVVHAAARGPCASVRVTPPGAAWTAVYAIVCTLALARRPRTRWMARAGVCLALAVSLARPMLWPAHPHPRGLRVSVLDVGQGDGLILEPADGRAWVMDAGDARGARDQGDRAVIPALLARGCWKPVMVVASHPHADHVGGMLTLLGEHRVARLLCSAAPARESRWRAVDSLAVAIGTPRSTLVAPCQLAGGRAWSFRMMSPTAARLAVDHDSSSTGCNERSLVLAVEWQGVRFLLTGDAGARSESLWLSAGDTVACDVLKVGHHGSRWATTDAFLAAAHPRVAVISVGRRNRFGHPSPEALARLARHGIPVLRTDRDGEVEFETQAGRLWVRTARCPRWREISRGRPGAGTVLDPEH